MKIVHISDLHFPTKLKAIALRKKSLIGYVNYAFRRRKKHQLHHALIESVSGIDYDCLVISGDVTNVSHEREFQEAHELLKPLLDERTFMIPGNHDRYTIESLEKKYYENIFGEYSGNLIPEEMEKKDKSSYLRWKKINGMVFIGWDSNIPLPPMQAQGYVDLSVPKKTIQFLNESKIQEYMLVCHHPIWNPESRQESERHKMLNRKEVLGILNQKPPIAFFHGHLHTNWVKPPDETIPFYVINSASSTRDSDSRHQSGYHIFSKEDNTSQWKIQRMVYDDSKNKFYETECINY